INGEYHRKMSPSETRVLKLIAHGAKYTPDLKIIKTAKSAAPIPANQNDGVKLADVLAAGGEWRGKIINKIGKIDEPAEFERQFRAEIKARMTAEFGAGSVPLKAEIYNASNVKYVEKKLSKTPEATRKKMNETLQEAVSYLPKSWIEKSNSFAKPLKLLLMKAQRAFYSESSHGLLVNSATHVEVYFHEFLHALQRTHPEIDKYCNEIHVKRTTLPNGKREKIATIEGYSTKEKGRADHYINPYYGKEYEIMAGVGNPHEILTMSFQHVLFGDKRYGRRDLFLHQLHEQGEPGHEIIDLVLGLLSRVK
ncbi:MAG: hypothetical protein ORN98_07850, partial [Alphaproteobacteria bacterium]|nr:hypothetical protein [Alphaproteobacteria bacterium]